jgi:hypothetical protein
MVCRGRGKGDAEGSLRDWEEQGGREGGEKRGAGRGEENREGGDGGSQSPCVGDSIFRPFHRPAQPSSSRQTIGYTRKSRIGITPRNATNTAFGLSTENAPTNSMARAGKQEARGRRAVLVGQMGVVGRSLQAGRRAVLAGRGRVRARARQPAFRSAPPSRPPAPAPHARRDALAAAVTDAAAVGTGPT